MRILLTAVFFAGALAAADDKADKKKALFTPLPAIVPAKLDRREPVDFDKEIRPILENKCEVCHSGAVKDGRYDLSTLEGLLKGGKSGAAVVPGKPDESLLCKLVGRTGVPPMPPKDEEPLTPAELALLRLWVAQGAKGGSGAATKKAIALGALPTNLRTIGALALSADAKTLAVGQGARLFLYDPATGKLLRRLADEQLKDGVAQMDLIHALAFSPDGKLLAAGGFQEAVLWDVASGKPIRKLVGFADRVVALDFSPDGKRLAAAGGPPTGEGEIKIFDPATGDLVLDLKAPHSDTVFAVRFSPDGTRLASAGADKFVKVFELPSGKLSRSLEGHTGQALDVDWRADGAVLISASADQTLKVWDYASGDQLRTIGGHGKEITRLALQRNQPLAFTASGDATVRHWNVDGGQPLRQFGGGRDALQALAIARDGSLVVSGGLEGVVRIHNGATGQLTQTITPSK